MFSPVEWEEISAALEQCLESTQEEKIAFLSDLKCRSPKIHAEVASLLSHATKDRTVLDSNPIVSGNLFLDPYGVGDTVGDFRLIEKLGEGSFGTVFKAVQISLERVVALKITPNLGNEARTMAALDHDGIVRVFSEESIPELGIRFVSMQFIPGSHLGETRECTEERLISLGVQLTSALTAAHQRGVLHLDIKPSNILIDAQGKPYLTDFNVSVRSGNGAQSQLLGGTEHYMSPEQRAFLAGKSSNLDERADIYSLATVLLEIAKRLKIELSSPLRRILERAIESDPGHRIRSADEFRLLLEGAKENQALIQSTFPESRLSKIVKVFPVLSLLIAQVTPQLIGSLINISYNKMRIVDSLSEVERATFKTLLVWWNPLIYVACVSLLAYLSYPIFLFLRHKKCSQNYSEADLLKLRHLALKLPFYLCLVTSLGWGGSAILFPAGLYFTSHTLSATVFFHFQISFILSWVIATTYSYINTQYFVLRWMIPHQYIGTKRVLETARGELNGTDSKIYRCQILSVSVPLVGAFLLLLLGADSSDGSHFALFRVLLLLFVSMAGMGLFYALTASKHLSEILSVIKDKRS